MKVSVMFKDTNRYSDKYNVIRNKIFNVSDNIAPTYIMNELLRKKELVGKLIVSSPTILT